MGWLRESRAADEDRPSALSSDRKSQIKNRKSQQRLQRQRRAPSQPVGNAPGQRRNNTLRAEGPTYHPPRSSDTDDATEDGKRVRHARCNL